MEYYSDMRKEEILQFARTQMKLEGIMLSKKTTYRKRQKLHVILYT